MQDLISAAAGPKNGLIEFHTFHISGAAGQKNGQSDQKRNVDGIFSATKTPRYQDYSVIYSFHICKRFIDRQF